MRAELMSKMKGQILTLSLGTYGCRVVQKALDFLPHTDQMQIAEELRESILTCVRDQNANHVVQKILERMSPRTDVDFIPQAFRGNVYSLAAHCYSCRVLQRIFEHCEPTQRTPLLEELLQNTERLMHDQYGNYVIQWVLSKGGRQEKDQVIKIARAGFLRLAQHKFASNVIEGVVKNASPEDRYALVEEIMQPMPDTIRQGSDEPVPAAVVLMKDQYGNYVLQRLLELADGQQKMRLIALIKPALLNLKRFQGYTKHLSAVERLLDANTPRTNAGTMTGTSTAASASASGTGPSSVSHGTLPTMFGRDDSGNGLQ